MIHWNNQKANAEEFWGNQLDCLARFMEMEPMQVNIYLKNEHVGNIGLWAEETWIIGYKLPYPTLGARQVFMVEELIPDGDPA